MAVTLDDYEVQRVKFMLGPIGKVLYSHDELVERLALMEHIVTAYDMYVETHKCGNALKLIYNRSC